MAQTAHDFETRITKRLSYLLFLPEGYGLDPDQRWPMILFLHGAGERGNDLNLVKKHGIPKVAERRPGFPFVCVSPQCPADSWWSEQREVLIALLDHVLAEYRVDPQRVYLTGLSMGGFGTWDLATRYPEYFAAIAPICGGGPAHFGFPQRVAALKEVPVWAFHGAKDPVVPVEESIKLVDALKGYGGDARLTIYPEAGHDSWTATYDNQELYDWFLSHRKVSA